MTYKNVSIKDEYVKYRTQRELTISLIWTFSNLTLPYFSGIIPSFILESTILSGVIQLATPFWLLRLGLILIQSHSPIKPLNFCRHFFLHFPFLSILHCYVVHHFANHFLLVPAIPNNLAIIYLGLEAATKDALL